MPRAILFTVCLLVAVGLFIYQVWGRFNLLRAATGSFKVDRVPKRLWAVATIALGQRKFIRPEVSWVRETLAGWLHFFVFWGFTVLGLQILTMFGRAYSEHFYVPLMSPSLLGGPYMFLRDCFEGIVLVCVLVLLARWAVTRPMRLIGFAPAENRQRAHHATAPTVATKPRLIPASHGRTKWFESGSHKPSPAIASSLACSTSRLAS